MSKTDKLIKDWQDAKQTKEETERVANTARIHLTNAITALGKRMLPKDPEKNEQGGEVCIWVPLTSDTERLLSVKKSPRLDTSDYIIEFRGEHRSR